MKQCFMGIFYPILDSFQRITYMTFYIMASYVEEERAQKINPIFGPQYKAAFDNSTTHNVWLQKAMWAILPVKVRNHQLSEQLDGWNNNTYNLQIWPKIIGRLSSQPILVLWISMQNKLEGFYVLYQVVVILW